MVRSGEIILFFDPRSENGYLSNFYRAGFELDKEVWLSSEHYYQAKKFTGTHYQEVIRHADSPAKAAQLGRNAPLDIRVDWDDVKLNVMEKAVREKFRQNMDLCLMLKETGAAELVEHTDKDSFWGDGGDGSGSNMLGKLIMNVRETMVAK